MSERKVKVELEAGASGYIPPVQASTKVTKDLVVAQKEASVSAKAAAEAQAGTSSAAVEAARTTRLLTTAQRDAVTSAKAAAAAEAEATGQLKAAQKEMQAATKDSTVLGDQRRTEAAASLEAAQKEASAAAVAKEASAAQAKAAGDAVTAHKTEIAIARENAAEEAAAAKASEAAAKQRAEAYTNTGKKLVVAGAVLVGAFVEAEKATSAFDKELSGVQAVSSASAEDMGKLSAAAMKAGKDTVFTATGAADAEGELVKAGVQVADVLDGALSGSLSLAAAGNLDVSESAEIAANTMNTFGLRGKDVAHIADVYAAAANKSAADVKELSYAMQQGGLVAAQSGLSFEDTTAVLAAFADRGLKGADAGTSMKTMLEKLNAPTSQAKTLMEQLGIVTYDASGKFVGITQFAGELHDKLGPLTDAQRNQALATLFGSDAIRAATVLYNLGSDGVNGYRQKIDDAGAAQRMAGEQMNNLSGDLHQLKGSLDVALIGSGAGANEVLRNMAHSATDVVNAFTSLPKPVQEAATGFAGGAGSVLLMVGGITTLAGKTSKFRDTLKETATTASGFKGALANAGSFMTGPYGLAIAGATAAISIFASKHHEAKLELASFGDALKEDGNAFGNATTAAVSQDLASKKLLQTFDKLGVSAGTVTDAALGNAGALKVLQDVTDKAAAASSNRGKAGLEDAQSLLQSMGFIRAYKGQLDDQLQALQKQTAATETSSAATGASAIETQKATEAAKDAAATLYAHAAGQRAVTDAETADADAAKDATTATKAHAAAHVDGTKITTAATAAAKAHKTEIKADATAQKDAAKAADSQGKANDAAAKSESAAANAAKVNADANASASDKKKANAAASKASAAASRTQASADSAASRASDAAAAAADKHSSTLDKNAKAKKAVADVSKAQAAADDEAAKKAAEEAEAAREATEVHKEGTAWLLAIADAEAGAAGSARDLDQSVKDEVGAMTDAKKTASTLRDALDALNGVHITASKAALDVQQKVADLTKALHENGTTMDITTESGRKNMGVVLDLASSINAHAQAVAEETGSVKAGNDALDASREEFDKVLQSAGVSKDKIKEFNETLLNTPKLADVTLKVGFDASAVEAGLERIAAKLGGTGITFGGGFAGKHIIPGYSRGGSVDGIGTTTSDENLVAVSNKEYIVNAASAGRPGARAMLDAINFGVGSTAVVKPQVPLSAFRSAATGDGSGALLKAIQQALSTRPAAGANGPLAVFNYSGTQAPTPEQQAIMMRRLAQAVTG